MSKKLVKASEAQKTEGTLSEKPLRLPPRLLMSANMEFPKDSVAVSDPFACARRNNGFIA